MQVVNCLCFFFGIIRFCFFFCCVLFRKMVRTTILLLNSSADCCEHKCICQMNEHALPFMATRFQSNEIILCSHTHETRSRHHSRLTLEFFWRIDQFSDVPDFPTLQFRFTIGFVHHECPKFYWKWLNQHLAVNRTAFSFHLKAFHEWEIAVAALLFRYWCGWSGSSQLVNYTQFVSQPTAPTAHHRQKAKWNMYEQKLNRQIENIN